MITTLLADASTTLGKAAADACVGVCNTTPLPTMIAGITNTLLFLVGALSVIMIIVGGMRYVASNGDPKRVADAKNTVTYAIAGLVIAILAYAVVQFVVSSVGAKPAATPISTPTVKAVPKR